MKKIIKGRKYDTETATCVGAWDNSYPCNDFHYYEETLYRKRNGEYFLHGEGGPRSKYAVRCGGNGWTEGEDITPLPYEAAREWAETHLTADEYEATFGEVSEDGEKVPVNLYLTAAAAAAIRREAAKEGIPQAAYMERLIMGKEE